MDFSADYYPTLNTVAFQSYGRVSSTKKEDGL